MNQPSSEQQAVLDCTARVRIVRAVPGSGKTWLVAELIKTELSKWKAQYQGVAALSFTRVGGEEIRRAVGHDLQHPHFVGTLDSFLFRVVVRPYLKKVFPKMALPRLIPAEWQPNEWSRGPGKSSFIVTGVDAKDRYNLFRSYFICEEGGNGKPVKAVIAYKRWDWKPMQILDGAAYEAVLEGKRKLIKNLGWLTHSDAALLASRLLRHKIHGRSIRAEVLRRFPLVIVDELQDTGWFLGKCVLELLSEPSARGVLVGDPDQAIYEFNGARPDLFDRFSGIPGAVQLPLGRSRRCAAAICLAARHFASPNRQIDPALDRTGRAFLLSYNDLESEVACLRNHLTTQAGDSVVQIVTRSNKTVENISGLSTSGAPKLGSVELNHLHRTVNAFRGGRQRAALAASRAAIEHATFDHEGLTDEELLENGIEPAAWKRACVDVLIEANREVTEETFGLWANRMSAYVRGRLSIFLMRDGTELNVKIRQPTKKVKQKLRSNYLVSARQTITQSHGVPVQTVHAVKGQTHDLTVFVSPEPSKEERCPSVVWWSGEESDAEERRIVFVAVTRTRGDLIVCVTEQCLDRLRNSRVDFVNAFECMSIQEFISSGISNTKRLEQ